jgi:hypothetical protein
MVSKTTRKSNLNFTYKKHESLNEQICFYCGHFGDVADHVPPLAWIQFYPDYPRMLIRACHQCNAHLGCKTLPTLISRVDYLIKRYRKKYWKILISPDWDDEEINELKGSLKTYVSISRIQHEVAHERIEFLMERKKQLLQDVNTSYD